MTTKKPAAGPVERRTLQAIEAFEKGVKAVGKRDFERAQTAFDEVIDSYPEERDVVERARAYRALCERNLGEAKRSSFRPKGFEDLVNHGVFLHNRGEYEEALKFLRQAAEIHPRNDHALYCLAATAARAGDTPSAVKALRTAISLGADNRALARVDSDFDPIRDDEEFVELVYPKAS
jgi:tetratricopeptide (TPR) repeat protein